MKMVKTRRFYGNYSRIDKSSVVETALQVGHNEASRQIGIPRRTISNWVVEHQKVRNAPKQESRGRKRKLSEEQEQEIIQMVYNKRARGEAVHEKNLKEKVWVFYFHVQTN